MKRTLPTLALISLLSGCATTTEPPFSHQLFLRRGTPAAGYRYAASDTISANDQTFGSYFTVLADSVPLAGATILQHEGTKQMAVGTTGPDGTAYVTFRNAYFNTPIMEGYSLGISAQYKGSYAAVMGWQIIIMP